MDQELLSGVLLPDEEVLWSCQAQDGLVRKVIPYVFILAALFFFSLSAWMFWISFLDGSATNPQPLYFQIFSSTLFALFNLWAGLSGKAVIPPSWYGLTQRRVLVQKHTKSTPLSISARFIEPGRAVYVEKRGGHFDISIPVVPEHAAGDRGFEGFENLSRADKEHALAIINETLGLRIQCPAS